MRLGSIIVAGLAAVASAIPATQVVKNINTITMKSRDLQAPAKSVTVRDAALIVIGRGNYPTIILGFKDIIVTGQNALRTMNPEQYTGNDADIIFDAFRQFVMVHQALLNILIGKAGLFEKVPLIGEPVAAVLRTLEGVVDALAFSLIDMVEERSEDLMNQANLLGDTLDECIEAYSSLI